MLYGKNFQEPESSSSVELKWNLPQQEIDGHFLLASGIPIGLPMIFFLTTAVILRGGHNPFHECKFMMNFV